MNDPFNAILQGYYEEASSRNCSFGEEPFEKKREVGSFSRSDQQTHLIAQKTFEQSFELIFPFDDEPFTQEKELHQTKEPSSAPLSEAFESTSSQNPESFLDYFNLNVKKTNRKSRSRQQFV